jgi:hypothetical protein
MSMTSTDSIIHVHYYSSIATTGLELRDCTGAWTATAVGGIGRFETCGDLRLSESGPGAGRTAGWLQGGSTSRGSRHARAARLGIP